MAEKNTNKGKRTATNRSDENRQSAGSGNAGFSISEAKMERLYDVLEAFIDTLDIPRNKGRAIKYGIRAIGEFMTPEEGGGNNHGGNQGNSRASLADDEQTESSGSMRRG